MTQPGNSFRQSEMFLNAIYEMETAEKPLKTHRH